MPDTHDQTMHRDSDGGPPSAGDIITRQSLASLSQQTTVEGALEEIYALLKALGSTPKFHFDAVLLLDHQQDRSLDVQTYQPDAQQGAGTQLLP